MSNIFLGLGGAGIDAVKAVYERSLIDKAPCNKNQYLLIDTDTHSKRNLPEVLQRSFIEIGSKSPAQIKEEALSSPQKEWFLDWYDYYDCNHSLTDGTGTVRPYGRIALLSKYDEIYHRLSSVLCELERELTADELLHVTVITGSCGGTGSAIALDISYMIRTIMLSGVIHNVEKCNNISLFVAMPELWVSMVGRNYDHYDPSLEYKYSANAVAFFTELQSAIDNSNIAPSPYYPLLPPAEWMKDVPFVPFSCCCVFESNRMTKDQVSSNMAEIASALSRVDDPDIFGGLSKSMTFASCYHIQEDSLSEATLRRCSEVVDMDLAVDRLKKEKVCYLVRPDFHIPINILNLMNEDFWGINVKEQVGIDVLSFHTFSFKDYAFYQQYRSRSDGRWAYVDKKFARKIVYSHLE